MPFSDLMKDNVEVLKSDGSRHPGLKASIQTNKIYMKVGPVVIEPNDLVIRSTSVATKETYRVVDPGFHEAHFGIPANYQMTVQRLSAADAASAVASMGGDQISVERRTALFTQWEEYGLDIIKQDLANGGFRFVGGPPATRKLALEWVRMKEAERAAVSPTISVSGHNSRVNIHSTDQSHNTVVTGGVFNELRQVIDDGVPNETQRVLLKRLIDDMEAAKDRKSFTGYYQALIASAADHMTIIAPFLTPLAGLLSGLAT